MNIHIPIFISSSLPSNNVLSGLPSAMKRLTLPTLSPNNNLSHLRFATSSKRRVPMSDQAKQASQSGADTSSPEKKENPPENPPEPPEKPLPDDCCGSGCVRCVWDVYYDELEAYNKLLSDIRNKTVTDSESN